MPKKKPPISLSRNKPSPIKVISPPGNRKPSAENRTIPDSFSVILDFVFQDGSFFLSLKNISPQPVFQVTVNFDKEIIGFTRTRKRGSRIKINTLELFTQNPFMAPGKTMTTFLDTSASYFTRRQPSVIQSVVQYTDACGQRVRYILKHNLAIYKEIAYCIPAVSKNINFSNQEE